MLGSTVRRSIDLVTIVRREDFSRLRRDIHLQCLASLALVAQPLNTGRLNIGAELVEIVDHGLCPFSHRCIRLLLVNLASLGLRAGNHHAMTRFDGTDRLDGD